MMIVDCRLVGCIIILSFAICFGLPAGNRAGDSVGQYAQRISEIPTEVIPLEARQFYESLTSDDKKVLQTVLNKSSSYTNVSQVLSDLRNGSTTLYNKAVGIVTQMRETIASLSPPARIFVDDSVSQIHKALGEGFSVGKIRTEIQAIVDRYSALDESAKEELKNAFPMVATVIYNNVFQTLATGLLGITAESSTVITIPTASPTVDEEIPPPVKVNRVK